jgi:hypothetical protein
MPLPADDAIVQEEFAAIRVFALLDVSGLVVEANEAVVGHRNIRR